MNSTGLLMKYHLVWNSVAQKLVDSIHNIMDGKVFICEHYIMC